MKRIILLLDGTWNDADYGPTDTNIVRLREIIARCLRQRSVQNEAELITPAASSAQLSISKGDYSFPGYAVKEHLIYYERGVGTGGFLDLYLGGAFGAGLSQNIQRAYRFLSQNFEAGDEVFIFGFSRGSYTARSLIGFINAVGLLKRDFCTPENESRAWYYYRKSPADRVSTTVDGLRLCSHRGFQISCLAVFDTVGALGIPISAFWRENRDLFEFHDVGLGTDHVLHLQALAIDEHRASFEPTLWRKPKFGGNESSAEQVWFPGAHSDVGGGNVDEERDRGEPALDDLTLDWMLKRVLSRFADFPVKHNGVRIWPATSTGSALAPQDEPRRGFYRTLRFAWRSINNIPVPVGIRQRTVGRDRHAETIGEAIHISALARLGREIRVRGSARYYSPANLISVLDQLAANYDSPGALRVVDYSGSFVSKAEVERQVIFAQRRLLEAEARRLCAR
jgi:uncharacterized protein (DUF2235 family)